jgi:hypothetical protein
MNGKISHHDRSRVTLFIQGVKLLIKRIQAITGGNF